MILRLDKFLADMGLGTRTEVKAGIRRGRAAVNGAVCKDPAQKADTQKDLVTWDSVLIPYITMEYYMLNKPKGVISATEDKNHQTVVDLLEDKKRKDLFPVGRLDIDTEGLLLITNDGILAHNLLSPKKHVDKCYFARVEGNLPPDCGEQFLKGVILEDGTRTLGARLRIISEGPVNEVELTIQEGKFHQVKRMFEAVGTSVIYLKRLSMGSLKLDESLAPGQYRALKKEELALLK